MENKQFKLKCSEVKPLDNNLSTVDQYDNSYVKFEFNEGTSYFGGFLQYSSYINLKLTNKINASVFTLEKIGDQYLIFDLNYEKYLDLINYKNNDNIIPECNIKITDNIIYKSKNEEYCFRYVDKNMAIKQSMLNIENNKLIFTESKLSIPWDFIFF
jgi:hypothetical protein